MRDNFCEGRPKKWRQILKPCHCNQRICTFPPLSDPPLIEDELNKETKKNDPLNLDNVIKPVTWQNFGSR
ncbi:hypothetical protein M3Y97_00919500 [Aphelenchoides bicaudatus]|nr:hypothetical protein M3Y97_00919500 [Aphelenchoides bicaudatus]